MPLTFHCSACQAPYPQAPAPYRCLACDAPLGMPVPHPDLPPRPDRRPPLPTCGVFRAALPPVGDPVSLGEARTPLVPFDLEGMTVLAKCDHTLPTGSYKDRGAALLMSYLRALGIEEAVEDSSGNAGAALAAYAARAKMRLKVFCPASASAGKLVQIRLYGAELIPVEGPRPQATEALLEYIDRTGAVYASHLWHPLFIEGLKTLAFELAEQLDWTAPDAVICPVGAGSILLGLYRGFLDFATGRTSPPPTAPHCRPSRTRLAAAPSLPRPAWTRSPPAASPRPTRAEGIALPRPVRDREVINALRQSAGTVVAVSEAAIVEGLRQLGRSGFCVEPTSAVIWDGLHQSPNRRSGGAGSADCGRAFGSRPKGGPTHR